MCALMLSVVLCICQRVVRWLCQVTCGHTRCLPSPVQPTLVCAEEWHAIVTAMPESDPSEDNCLVAMVRTVHCRDPPQFASATERAACVDLLMHSAFPGIMQPSGPEQRQFEWRPSTRQRRAPPSAAPPPPPLAPSSPRPPARPPASVAALLRPMAPSSAPASPAPPADPRLSAQLTALTDAVARMELRLESMASPPLARTAISADIRAPGPPALAPAGRSEPVAQLSEV